MGITACCFPIWEGGYSTCKRDRSDPLAGRWSPRPVGNLDLHPGYESQSVAGIPQAAGLWSAGYQPVPPNSENMQVTFFAHMAVFRRTENDITSSMEITVCPDDPVEIRRIHLHNTKNKPRRLRLTSYGEVILTQHGRR